MKPLDMKKWYSKAIDILLLEHTDLDGYGNEVVLRTAGFNPTVINLENSQVDSYIDQLINDFMTGEKAIPEVLIISDIAPTEKVAEKVEEFNQLGLCPIYLFDHHPTALGLNQYEWATVIVEEAGGKPCGTSLLYRFLKENNTPLANDVKEKLDIFVEEVRLYDTWEWEKAGHESAKSLNDLFYLVGSKTFVESRVAQMTLNTTSTSLFSPDEEKLLEVEEKRIKQYLKRKNKEMLTISNFFYDNDQKKPLIAGVVQADNYNSELGHYLCEEHPEIDFVLMLSLTRNKASLRAVKDDINLIPIVKQYNGGGHPHAAGCEISPMGIDFLQRILIGISKK